MLPTPSLLPRLALLLLSAVLVTSSLAAQTPPRDVEGTIVVDDSGNNRRIRLALPSATRTAELRGEALQAADVIETTLRDDLEQSGIFDILGPTELSVAVLTGDRDRDLDQYRSLGGEVSLETRIGMEDGRLVLDGWAYDLPSKQSIIGKRYRGTLDQARLVAHYLADAMVFQFTSKQSLALTTLAFQSDRDGHQELYLMDYDGHNQRRISGHQSTSGYSDWAPSGDRIAYMSYFSGTPGIYYVDLASGDKVPIYADGVLNLSPSFAPDGSLVFASSSNSNVDIYSCTRQCRTPRRLTDSRAIDTNPSVSPTGDRIAFTSARSGRPNIYVMNADGSGVRRISFEGNYNDGAAWRPDGAELVYASRQGGKFRLAVTSLVDLTTRIVAQGPDSYEEPSFSPDGKKIAYTVRKGQAAQVWVMDADGRNPRQLTYQGNNAAPDWSPYPSR